MKQLMLLALAFLDSVKNLLPIVVLLVFFQGVVLRQPLPDVANLVGGMVLVVLGLALFVRGLEMGLFPLGENMAYAFARKGSLAWLLVFAFCLGFGTTVAEPALIAVANAAAKTAAQSGAIAASDAAQADYATGLRLTVALAVGVAIVLGVLRIVHGWPVHFLMIGGYVCATLLSFFVPREILGLAYDSGGVTTSTITVPLVTALGVGLASSLHGRNPMMDGFGLIALASLVPILFVMVFGMAVHGL